MGPVSRVDLDIGGAGSPLIPAGEVGGLGVHVTSDVIKTGTVCLLRGSGEEFDVSVFTSLVFCHQLHLPASTVGTSVLH